jgi:RHS repeat-associated protein
MRSVTQLARFIEEASVLGLPRIWASGLSGPDVLRFSIGVGMSRAGRLLLVLVTATVLGALAWTSARTSAQTPRDAGPTSSSPASASVPGSSAAAPTTSAPPATATAPNPAVSDLADLSDARAVAVAREHAAPLLDAPQPGPVPAEVLDEHTAIKRVDGRRVLLESPVPMFVRRGSEWVAADPELRPRAGSGWQPTAAPTPLDIPASAGGAVTFDGDLRVRLAGARDVPGVADGAGVVFPNALADTDAIVAAAGSGVRVAWVLRSAQSPTALTLDLDLGADRALEPHAGGFRLTEDGRAAGAVSAPVAWDADHNPVSVTLARTAAGVVAKVDPPEHVAYPIVVDPVIDTEPSNSDLLDFQFSASTGCGGSYGVSTGSVSLHRYCSEYENPAGDDSAQLQLRSPGTSFVSRMDIGGFGVSGAGQCGSAGIRSSGGANEGVYGASGTGTIGPRPNTDVGCSSVTTPQKICVTSTCGVGGSPGNRAFVSGSFADTTGPGHDWAESGSVDFSGFALYREDTDRPTVGGSVATPVPWRKSGTVPVTVTGSDTGLGVKRVKVSFGLTTLTTGADPCLGTVASACPATWNNRTLQKTLTPDVATLPEGLVTLTLDAEDVLGNTASTPLPTVKVGVDRSGPVIAFPNGGVISGAPMGGTAQKSLRITVGDGTATGPDAQRRSGVASAVVEISKVDGSGYQQEASYAPAAGCVTDACAIDQIFAIDATKYGPGTHTVRVTATDQVGNTSTSSLTFTVDTTGPQITLSGSLHDARGTTLTKDEYRLQADVIDGVYPIRGAGTKDVELYVTELVGGVPTERLLESTTRTCKDVSCDRVLVATVDTTKLQAGGVTFRLHATDALGNASDQTFTATRGAVSFDQTRWSGLEDFLQYDQVETGGGSSAYVNLASGNLVWQQTAMVNPGRGLSTFAQVTYNAQAGAAGYDELGQGWSLTLSGLTRVNEPLDLSTVAAGTVRLIDGDGTQHPFALSADGTYFRPPPGVDLHLRRFSSDQQRAWAITRPDGVTFFYDSLGFQTYAEDRNGNDLKYSYEIVPKVAGASCPMWPSATLDTAQCRQRLVKVTDASGLAPSYAAGRDVTVQYASATGRIASLTDHVGRVTQFTYDTTTGRLTTLTEALGTTTERSFGFGYEPTGSDRDLAWVNDPRGNTTQFTYTGGYATLTAAGLVGDPLSDRRVTTLRDRRTNTHTYSYATEPAGGDNWWRTTLTDARSKSYVYRLDRRGRPVRRTDPLATGTAMAYDADNNLTVLTEAQGTADEAVTRMAYNVNGRLIEKIDPVGNRTVLRYRDGDGFSPGATYSDNRHGYVSDLLRIERPKGSDTGDPNDFATRFELDERGNVTASIDATGGRAETTYLDWGLVDYEKDPVGTFTSYHQYDPSGLPKEVWDPKNGKTYYAYDAVGNVTAVADPRSEPYGGLSDAQKRYRTTLTYDAQDRLKTEEIPKRSAQGQFITRSYGYNQNGDLVTITDGTGAVTTNSFDAMDNVLEQATPAILHAGDATAAVETTKYTYDAEQNVTSEARPSGFATAQADDYSTAYTYDDVNRPVVERRRSRTASTSQDIVTSYAYDRRENVVGLSDPKANATWPADPALNAATTARQREAYTYDKADRQTVKVEDPAGLQLTTRTAYDENGNVVRVRDARNKGAEFGPADPLTPDATYEALYTYDAADRPVSRSRDGSRTEVSRRADGLVSEVRHPRSFTAERVSADDFVTKYGYDALGDVTSVTLPRIASSASPYANAVRTLSLTRDAVGNATTVTDPRGRSFTNTYFDTGDLLTTTRPSAWTFAPGAGGGGELTLKDPDALGGNGGDEPDPDAGQGAGDFGAVAPQPGPEALPQAGDVQLAYDDELRLTSVTELESPLVGGTRAQRTLARDAVGRVTSLTTPYQRAQGGTKATIVQKTAYDRNGNVAQLTDGEGFTTSRALDQFDRPIAETTPASSSTAGAPGNTTQYTYDDNSNVVAVREPDGDAWTQRSCFDRADRLVASIDEQLAVDRYRVDNIGQIVRQRSPRGTSQAAASPSCGDYPMLDGGPKGDWDTDTRHDPNGWVTQVVDPVGNLSSSTYDRAGNRTQSSEPGARAAAVGPVLPKVTATTYDARDLPWATSTGTTTAPHAKTTTVTEYDGNSNLRRTVKSSGLVGDLPRYASSAPDTTSYASASDRANTAVAQASWRATLNEFDDDNQLVAVHLPWGDAANPANTTDKRWRQDFERDARGYVTAIRQVNDWTTNPSVCAAAPAAPVGTDCVKREAYSYYDNGWIRTGTGPDAQNGANPGIYGERQIYDYDRRGLQTSWQTKTNRSAIDDGEAGPGRTTTRDYFPSGMLKSRVASAASSATRTSTYGYDANGQTLSLLDTGVTTATTDDRSYALGYDRTGRPTSHDEQWTGGKDTLTAYDLAGNRTSQRTDGTITDLATGAYSGGKTTASDWDHVDREVATTVTPAGGAIERWQRSFHPSGEPEAVVEAQQANTTAPWITRLTESHYFRDDGQPVSDNKVNASGASQTETGLPQAYAYDADGNRTQDEGGSYIYNARDQLTKWTRPRYNDDGSIGAGSDTTDYTLDGNGDLRSESDTSGGALAGMPTTTYNYLGDRLLNTTAGLGAVRPATVYGYDAAGGASPTTIQEGAGKRTSYAYDAYNRVTSSTPQTLSGSTWSSQTSTQSGYDAFDRRSAQTIGSSTKTYGYAGAEEELSTLDGAGGGSRRFDYSAGGEQLGMGGGGAGYKSFGLTANGSIGSLENDGGSSAAEAGKANRYRYDPYGAARTGLSLASTPAGSDLDTQLTGDAQANPLRFQGFVYDSALKTYDMKARAYRPETGRFQTADRLEDSRADLSLESDPLTQSRYAWAGGNPITNVEYDGHNIFEDAADAVSHPKKTLDDAKDTATDAAETGFDATKEVVKKDPRYDAAKGATESAADTFDAVTHPARTAKGFKYAVKHPKEAVKAVAHTCDGKSPAECGGYAAGELAGAKGAGGVVKGGVKAGVRAGGRAAKGVKGGGRAGGKPDVRQGNKASGGGKKQGREVPLPRGWRYRGGEFQNRDRSVRVAPFGNDPFKSQIRNQHTGEMDDNPLHHRLPHYHRRKLGPDGQTRPGQGTSRHRPWQKSKDHDKRRRDRL